VGKDLLIALLLEGTMSGEELGQPLGKLALSLAGEKLSHN
jgi:hypothetical protein